MLQLPHSYVLCSGEAQGRVISQRGMVRGELLQFILMLCMLRSTALLSAVVLVGISGVVIAGCGLVSRVCCL